MNFLIVTVLAAVLILGKLGSDQWMRRGWQHLDAREAIVQAELGVGIIVYNDTPTLGDWWFMPRVHWPIDTETMPENGFSWLESRDDPLTELLPRFGFALVIRDRNTRMTLESFLGSEEGGF